MRILYIEDNPNDAKLVQRYVETTPHDLVIAPTLEDTYEYLSDSEAFGFVMVDILINNQRAGYELPQLLREQGYTGQVIAVTALNSPQDKVACAEAGFAAILTKPFLMTALADILTQFTSPI
ncbi:MAG: response regulator [Chloroflexota bacterium]